MNILKSRHNLKFRCVCLLLIEINVVGAHAHII